MKLTTLFNGIRKRGAARWKVPADDVVVELFRFKKTYNASARWFRDTSGGLVCRVPAHNRNIKDALLGLLAMLRDTD